MPYNAPSIKFSFTGIISGTREVFDTGLKISGGAGWDGADTFAAIDDTFLGNIATLFTSLMQGGGLNWANYSHFTAVKAAFLDTAGHYRADPKVHAVSGSVGLTSGSIYPHNSVVLSLTTGHTVGKGNRGRMRLPHCQIPLSGGPLVDSSAQATVLANGVTFIHGVNDLAADLPHSPVVAIMSAVGAGTTKQVADVRVGSVQDTVRERSEQLAVTYLVTAL